MNLLVSHDDSCVAELSVSLIDQPQPVILKHSYLSAKRLAYQAGHTVRHANLSEATLTIRRNRWY